MALGPLEAHFSLVVFNTAMRSVLNMRIAVMLFVFVAIGCAGIYHSRTSLQIGHPSTPGHVNVTHEYWVDSSAGSNYEKFSTNHN